MLTRFAPAPTGYLHLGHVANAIHVWGLADRVGARVLLRIEDHDRQRCRPAYERALLEDLEWLGFVPAVYGASEFRAGRCAGRQSDRAAIYADTAAALADRGLVYACACTRRDVPVADGSTHERPYPGTCRDRHLPLDTGLTWRVRMAPDEERFDDWLCGAQRQRPVEQCGDMAIRDRRGNWTYQFVATVDDHAQGIDLVIRGRDLLHSTGRQLALGRLIGRTRPAAFAHHPLIMKSPTQKLSKSDGDTGVRDLRAAGWKPERVIGEAAARVGLGAGQPLRADEAGTLFIEGVTAPAAARS